MMRRTSIGALLALSLATASGVAAPGDPQPQPQPVRPQPQPVRPQPQPVRPQPQPVRPPIPAAVYQAKATPYVRATTRPVWPAGSTRRQLVIGGGWRGERFAWLIADGTKLVAVYRAGTQADLDDLVAKFIREMVFATVGSPADKTEWGVAGAIKVPLPPPPPEPGGHFPKPYVDAVMAAAWRLDTQVLQPQQLESMKAPVATPATPATR